MKIWKKKHFAVFKQTCLYIYVIYNGSTRSTKIWICEICIGNPEMHEIVSGTKHFITFLSLRFFDMRRERHNFFYKRATDFVDPQNRRLSSRLESQLTAFFQIPKILNTSGHDVIHVPGLFPSWGFYCDFSDCHINPPRAWTPALNVCT